MNLEKAVAFVRSEGNDIERARLDYLLTGTYPSREVITQLFAG